MTAEDGGSDRAGDAEEVGDIVNLDGDAGGGRKANGTFAPGHSGNRRGRPKQSRNLVTLFNEKRDELVAIKIDGKSVRKSRMDVLVTNLWNRAIALDPKALASALMIMRATGQIAEPAGGDGEMSEDNAAVLDAFLARAMLGKTNGG